MSIRLILEEYLGMMKESGELDVFLPELLAAMGHEIVFQAQRGVRQYGVDMVSRGPNKEGHISLHLWVLKGGDVDRAVWSSGVQSIRNSMVEIEDVFLKTHVQPADKSRPVVVHILTNTEFKQEVTVEVAQFCNGFSSRNGVDTQIENGSVLAAWTEHSLLDEYVLPANHRSLFRRSLAMVDTPDVCYRNGRELVNALCSGTPPTSPTAKLKAQLRALRAVLLAIRILHRWADQASNLEGAYQVCEFAVLRTWCYLQESSLQENETASQVFAHVFGEYEAIAKGYMYVLEPFYTTENAFAAVYRDDLLVADRVFEELGRLGLLACAYRCFPLNDQDIESASNVAGRVVALIRSHPATGSPCFDRQSTDVSLALLGLMAGGQLDDARSWLAVLVNRLGIAKNVNRFAPIAGDSFDDVIAIRDGEEPVVSPFGTSTLVPMLGLWCAFLKMDAVWKELTDKVVPQYAGTTFNLWSAGVTYEAILADGHAIAESGYADAFLEWPPDRSAFLRMITAPAPGVPEPKEFHFVKAGWAFLSLMASRHWRKQLPHAITEMLVQQFNSDTEAVKTAI